MLSLHTSFANPLPNATDRQGNMTTLSKGFGRSASKRARSQDSQRSLTPAPALKASKKDKTQDITRIPAFLRQTKAGKLLKFGAQRQLVGTKKYRYPQQI